MVWRCQVLTLKELGSKAMLAEPVEVKPKKVAASEGDKDKSKMREAVESAIVQEKPNVKWEDIAGLEQVCGVCSCE